jgi:hypothetical protein
VNRALIRQNWRTHFRSASSGALVRGEATVPTEHGLSTTRARQSFTLRIQIEELELRGVGHVDRHNVAATLEDDLRGLIGAKGIPADWGQSRFLDCAEALPPSRGPRVNASWLGAQLARTIYELRNSRR